MIGSAGAVGGWIGDHRFDPRFEFRTLVQRFRPVLLQHEIRRRRLDGANRPVPGRVEPFSDSQSPAGPAADDLGHRAPLPSRRARYQRS
jgi:hypothetical protein